MVDLLKEGAVPVEQDPGKGAAWVVMASVGARKLLTMLDFEHV